MRSAEAARAELIDRLRDVARGDREALRFLYDRTSAKLFGICLRILRDPEEAADVLQDVYLAVWNRAESFDPGRASPITWLATIARNRAIDRVRQTGRRGFDGPVEEASDLADDQPDGLAVLVEKDESRRLADCLAELDERTRRAIATAFFEGVTYEALAGRAGVPLGTMKSMIRRGLIRLKGCLTQ